MTDEEKYIEQRKKQAERLSREFRLMQEYPIQDNKIVFSTFEGDGGFCCNPRYIAEEIHRRNLDFEMVWLVHDITREFPNYIRVVEDTQENMVRELATAKMWIDNYRKPYGTVKREGQIYIQTWHASLGFKAVGLYRGDLFPTIARLVSEWDSSLIDYMISNSDYCDKVYPKKILYSGKTLRTGSPRVDCLINEKEKLHIEFRASYNLPKDVKLVLFAPTFRGGNQTSKKQVDADAPSIDFEHLIEVLKRKFGGQWKVLLRLHPQLSAKLEEMPLNQKDGRLIDVSKEPDISQIMGACDLVITDYSSCAFDACFAGIPVQLYADDVQEYINNRGKFMWEKKELPFDMAETNEELIQNICEFDERRYLAKVHKFMEEHNIIEDGKASKYIVDYLSQILG